MDQLQPLQIPLHSAIEEYVAARAHLNSEPLLSAVKQHVTRRRNPVVGAVGFTLALLVSGRASI